MKAKGIFEKVVGSGIWWIRFSDGTKYPNGESRIRYEKAGSKSTAQKLLALRKTEVLKGEKLPADRPSLLVSALKDGIVQNYKDKGQKDISHLESRLENHIIPFFGGMKAHEVGTDAISKYVKQRRAAKAEHATINRELAVLRRMFRLAFNHEPQLVTSVPKIIRLKENKPREGFCEDDQYEALIRATDELWLKGILATGYTFAFRRGELLSMRVKQIDLTRQTIKLAPGTTKNNEARTIVMTDEVFDLISQCVAGKGKNDFVFTRGSAPVLNFRGAWDALCVKADCEGLLFHDLRRSGVRNLINVGVDEKTAMLISGHKTRSVFQRYNIRNEDDLRDAASKLERRRGKRTESKTEAATQGESHDHVEAA
jgi:integrase